MFLYESLYQLQSFSFCGHSNDTATGEAQISLHAWHPLFDAHFPGHPVLPGAVLLRIVYELFNHFGRSGTERGYELQSVRRAKFQQEIDPRRSQFLRVAWQERDLADRKKEIKGYAETGEGERCATFTLLFRPIPPRQEKRGEKEAVRPEPKLLDKMGCCVVIPAYACWGPLFSVLHGVYEYASHILVVDDGSGDEPTWLLDFVPADNKPYATGTCGTNVNGVPFTLIRHPKNRGKGAALATGFAWAREQGFRYALTIDADGQHAPGDIPHLAHALTEQPGALIVGCRRKGSEDMPGGNRFANRFSNFWFSVETLQRLPDTQSGFRIYPLDALCPLHWLTARYEAELELLVWAAWQGVPLIGTDVSVHYPPRKERISHFRPLRDFGRISLLNCVLCFLAVTYGIPRTLIRRLRHGRS